MQTKLFTGGYLVLAAVCLLALIVSPSSGQKLEHPSIPEGSLEDWSMHRVFYARIGSMNAMWEAAKDPRAALSWRAADREAWKRHRDRDGDKDENENENEDGNKHFQGSRSPQQKQVRDWSINLGTAGTAPAMYPAKFTFSTSANPTFPNSCTTDYVADYVVFPVNAAGSATQPNIVAFINLYSGTAGGNGLCNRTASANDTGTAATVYWSYNVQGIAGGGAVATSPALSLDGAKIAFVETKAGSPAHFHVLAWKSGDGRDVNLQNVLKPHTIIAFSANAPAARSGTATDLALGASGTDTLSSPFIDYGRDLAYVGNDLGIIYRIKNVFCTANPACAGATPPAPSLDTTWGGTGAVTVGAGSCAGAALARLTDPVPDFVTGNVFVGCSDGKLYGFTSTGTALAASPVTVGNGTATGHIVDSPVVDGVNKFVYVVSGNSASGSAVLVQTKTDLTSVRTVNIGAGGTFNLHAPQFNDAYFSSATSTNWLIYAAGFDAAGNFDLFGATFDNLRNLKTGAGTPANTVAIGTPPACEYSPLTEFLNGANDWLFLSILCAGPGNIGSAKVATFPAALTTIGTAGNGTSAIIVDNSSAVVQASSIYFGTQKVTAACNGNGTGGCAVKLTQAAFQ
jgi:hypothetical protein